MRREKGFLAPLQGSSRRTFPGEHAWGEGLEILASPVCQSVSGATRTLRRKGENRGRGVALLVTSIGTMSVLHLCGAALY